MKKIVIFMLMLACITISGCGDKTIVDNSISSPATDVESSSTTSTTMNDDIQIFPTDFVVSDGNNSLELYMVFKDFKTDMNEEKIDNNYVGETYSGDAVYKTYMHKYSDLDLYVSNLNYDIDNRSVDEYIISQITLKGSKYKTARGITIGSKLDEVYTIYGRGEKSTVEGKEILIYKYDQMELSFTIDGNQMVQEVVLMIKAKNS